MQKCGQPGCEFKTNVSSRMENHVRQSGHGRTSARRKEYRGHVSVRSLKKQAEADQARRY